MRVLIAPFEFKGTLTAVEVARTIADAVVGAQPSFEVDAVPLSDGGPGLVEAVLMAAHGRRITTRVRGPLGAPVDADWALLDSKVAVIEMAAASGLTLLDPQDRDAMRATTLGTG